jgi:hypothetical protein
MSQEWRTFRNNNNEAFIVNLLVKGALLPARQRRDQEFTTSCY